MLQGQVDSAFETILYEKREGIAWITLNRPKVLNTYNMQMRDDLYEVLGAVKHDPDVKSVVLSAAGEKAFCAGADLSEFLTAPSPVIARRVRWERDLWGLFMSLPQPAIAAMHGYVLGSGIEMALCCDIRLASEDARFGLPESTLGIIPAAGGTQTLPRIIGKSRALEMMITGQWVDAEHAYASGLVNRIVPKSELLAQAESTARTIMSYPQEAVRAAKQAIVRGLDMSLAEGIEMERRLARPLLRSCAASWRVH